MGQLTSHGIHDHSEFFKADDNKSINGGRKGPDLGKWTDFAHGHGQVPSLGDARVKLKRGENQGQNDVTNGQVDNEFIEDGFQGPSKEAGEEWQKPKLALLSVVALLVAAEATAEAKICQCGPTSTRLQCLNFFWAVTAPAILPQLFWP